MTVVIVMWALLRCSLGWYERFYCGLGILRGRNEV